MLRNRKVHMNRLVDALQRRQLSALVEVLPWMYVGQSHAGTKRRPDRLAGDQGLRASDLGMRNIEVCAGAIDFLLGCGKVLSQRAATIQNRLSQDSLGLLGPQV